MLGMEKDFFEKLNFLHLTTILPYPRAFSKCRPLEKIDRRKEGSRYPRLSFLLKARAERVVVRILMAVFDVGLFGQKILICKNLWKLHFHRVWQEELYIDKVRSGLYIPDF